MNEQSQEHLDNLRHSCAHLLAAAVMQLWPTTKRTIGPAIENGFYFDFEFESPISEKDFPKIEKKMKEIAKRWDKFERFELSADDAKKEYPNNQFKHELIEEFSRKGEVLTFYKSGDYWDLCRGGHVENPKKELQHFKLLSVAGAYWRGSEKNPMLTRIYGTCFDTKEELDQYILQLEEAKKRDHRKLGKDLGLFAFDDMVGKGLPLWLPKGTIIKTQIEKLVEEMEDKYGYDRVWTPHMAKKELYLTSGHLPYYEDSMYPAMKMDDGTYYMKAMNCPHHHVIYKSSMRSYKELPLRLAEYGTVYRNELSGTLAGLLRVRALTMNDAHIYCTKDQVEEEFEQVINLTVDYFKLFGLKDYWFRLSKWDPNNKDKYIDQPKNWEYAEGVLRKILTKLNVKFIEAENEAAFYGPKVDVQFKSVIGREETMSTIQLDFAAKERFGLTYIDNEGKDNNEVFVIHRAPLSTHERFMAFLIEHFAGAFPTWLSPVQAKVLPISEKQVEYCRTIVTQLKKSAVRVEFDERNESIGKKIREAEMQKIPYMLIVGDKEIQSNEVAVRARNQKDLGTLKLEQFIEKITEEIKTRSL